MLVLRLKKNQLFAAKIDIFLIIECLCFDFYVNIRHLTF